jgi:heme-degrading monooxygenase HmoA
VTAVGNGPVVSVLELHVLPGSEQAVARAYDELGIFERSRESGGFRSGRLLEASEPGRPLLVIAEWDDAASYERWLSNPVRAELGSQLEPMLADEPAAGGIFYERAKG